MDTNRIDALVDELIMFDPSLKEHEASLRAFLSEFEEKKPLIHIDQHFVTGLRARLMLTEHSHRSPFQLFNWWALRLAPVGVVALLVLALTSSAPSPIDQRVTREDDAFSDPRILDIEKGGEVETSAPTMPYGMGGDSLVSSESADMTMSIKAVSVENVPSPFTVGPQTPGYSIVIDRIITGVPGFAVVSRTLPQGGEEIVGTSPLIYEGTTERVPISLRTPTGHGDSYILRFHIDNGNRIFNEGEDAPLTDASGAPVSTWVEIVSP